MTTATATLSSQIREISSKAADRLIDIHVRHGLRCPECHGTHTESNGSKEYRCVDCDHRWGFDCGEWYGF